MKASVRTAAEPHELRPLFVIVEAWERRLFGRGKRAWLAEFTEEERRLVSDWQGRIRKWMLQTGLPQEGAEMAPRTLDLLNRAANLFAGI